MAQSFSPSRDLPNGSADAWMETSARVGYAAKGVVYIVVGLLSAQAAWDAGRATGSKGALRSVLEQPFGRILLGILVVGLAAYAIWRCIQAFADPENKGTDMKGTGMRLMYACSALLHFSLVVFSVRMLMGSSGGSGGGTEEKTASLMAQPFGRWMVFAGGLVVLAWAVRQLYKAYTVDLSDRLELGSLSTNARRWAVRIGRAGIGARGVAFSIVAFFFLLAAWRADPEKAQGLGESLRWLESQAYGPWLMSLVAVGLSCYGGYMLLKSRYRRIG